MEFLVSIHITLFSMSSTIKGYIAFVRVAQEKGARDGKLRNASANVSVRVLKIVAAIIDALLILLTALEVILLLVAVFFWFLVCSAVTSVGMGVFRVRIRPSLHLQHRVQNNQRRGKVLLINLRV